MAGQDFLALAVIDGNRKEITFAICAQQGGWLDGVQLIEFAGLKVDRYLALI